MMAASVLTVLVVLALALPRGLGLRRRCRPLDERAVRPLAPRLIELVDRLRRRTRRRTSDSDRWIDALDELARATATGDSLAAALDRTAGKEWAPEALTAVARARLAGDSLAAVLTVAPNLPGRTDSSAERPDPDEVLAMSVLRAVVHSGGPVSEPLDRAAGMLRERRTARDERQVAAAQARLSARVLAVLPAGFALWSVSTDPRAAHLLLGTPVGLICVVVGGGLNLIGWWWMRRIVSSP